MCAAQLLDVLGRAHERQRDEVRAQLGRERQVGEVLLGDRGQLRAGVGDVDALARPTARPGDSARRDDLAGRRRRSTARRGTPSPMTSCERSVTSAAKCGKSTRTRSRRLGAAAAAEDDRVAGRQRARLGVARTAAASAPAGRTAAPSGRPARSAAARTVGGPPAQVVVRAVRAVQPRAVHAGRDEPVQHPGRVGRGPERGHDLRPPPEHRRSVAPPSPQRPGRARRAQGR